MPFPIHFECTNPELSKIELQPGEMLFVLGANGVGKSSLMHHFSIQNYKNVRKIAAHRQTWMSSDALDMTPANKIQVENNIQSDNRQQHGRYKDDYAAQRASLTIYDLIDAENIRARSIASSVDAGDINVAKEVAKTKAPIAIINELLRLSNIPVEISVQANERVMARKHGGAVYSASQLSDGERNALLIAGSVLTAPVGTLIIVDEPERHLHRSIISPLLSQLFERRPDCAFIVSTHDHDLPLENKAARTLLIRSCSFDAGGKVERWDADELGANAAIDDLLKRDLLGSRRKILFVEGTESSLDKPLYSLIFPQVSVIPKGSCREVEHAVHGVTIGEQLHWIKSFGIVDGDGLDNAAIAAKKTRGVFAVPYYSVEAIYYHPKIIELIASAQAGVLGDDANVLLSNAIAAGIKEVVIHKDRLCEKVVKKAISSEIEKQLPDGASYMNGVNINIIVDSQSLLASRVQELTEALNQSKWETVLAICPIRECGARENIITALKLRTVGDYNRAVQNLLATNNDALTFVRSLFDDLYQKIYE